MNNFEWDVYLKKNPDLVENNINTKEKALNHFRMHGINEKRFYNKKMVELWENYDWTKYKNINPKLNTLDERSVFFYYYFIGQKNNDIIFKKEDILFFEKQENHKKYIDLYKKYDWEKYLSDYQDLKDANLKTNFESFTHYINHGINEGRKIYLKPKIIDNIKFYLINLDYRIDRYNSCKKEFEKIGLTNIERFSAIKPTLKEIKKYTFLNINNFWKKDKAYIIGASGCKLSHYNILKKAYNENINEKYICILEDDVYFEQDALINLDKSIDYIEQNNINFNILYFSINLGPYPNKDDYIKISDNLLKLNKSGLTATAYIIKTNNIINIINKIESSDAEIDNCYRDFINERYCVYPMCVKQKESFSDIINDNVDYKDYNKII